MSTVIVDWNDEAAWAGTRRPLQSATALPADCYTDDRFFALEREHVFGTAWVCVGALSDLQPVDGAQPVLARQVGARSVIITRSRDGELQGFLNACRHRGTRLVECDGSVEGIIRCPYHRWGYDLTGRLVATPRFEDVDVDDFDRTDYPLHGIRIDAWNGLVFACLSERTMPLDAWLGDLTERLAGYRLDTWAPRDESSFTVDANWKLISENYQEYYHLPWVHPELAKVSRVEDHYRYQGPGLYCGQCTSPVSGDERDDWTAMPPAPGLGPSDAASGRFVAVFPNLLLSVLPNHAFVIILDPLEPGRTVERGLWLLPPTSSPSDAALAATKTFWVDVNDEDIEIVERGQRGLAGGYPVPGRLSPRFEEPLHRFHNMLADRMTGVERVPDGDPDDSTDLWGSGINPLPWTPSSRRSTVH